jgi:hypothetical protein
MYDTQNADLMDDSQQLDGDIEKQSTRESVRAR